ncbi:MAG: FkbM family methyltransferase [Rhodobacteraceae bacterium]|nr:FkbM family methyltransferase [Paracoccaceae bacterium]
MFEKFRVNRQIKKAGLTSPMLGEGRYDTEIDGETVQVTHSPFNPAWLEEMAITPQVIFDVGSYDGGDGLRLKRHFPSAQVVSVEADPEQFEQVRSHVQSAGNILVNSAICDHDGEIDWFSATIDGKSHAQGSLYRQSKTYKRRFGFVVQASEPVKVPATRLDTLCQRLGIARIDLLHMDIEGAEFVALQSLGDIRPTIIYLELSDKLFVGSRSRAETQRLLADMGYEELLRFGPDRLYRYRAA